MPPEPVDVVPLLSAAKVTVVAGKGGVGKTTVTALLARAAADAGRRVITVELDGKPTLAELVGDVPLLALSAPLALEEYLREHGFSRIAKRLAASGVIDVVSTAAPGIDDLVVLGKIKQLERSGDWDTIVVDGPAAGHAVTMLTSPAGLRDAVSSGPVRAQAEDVLAMLTDAGRCQVALVTLAETTPVNETIATAFTIEDRVGVKLAPVFVNAVDLDAVINGAVLPSDDDLDAAISSPRRRRCHRRGVARRGAVSQRTATRPTDCDRSACPIPAARPIARSVGHRPARRCGRLPTHSRCAPRPERRRPARGWRSMTSDAPPATLRGVLDEASVVVCCGSGGVGKTTVAAAFGVEAARRGRRVVVLTIDPAKRLADALGVDELGPEPCRIDPGGIVDDEDSGELWAMMLDTGAAFNAVVRRYAADREQADRIVANAFFRNMAGSLSGTQEYMAAETLHLLARDERFDLVVVDTPPTRSARSTSWPLQECSPGSSITVCSSC